MAKVEHLSVTSRVEDVERLIAVRATGLLDADVNEDLQRLVELAREMLDIPVSIVSLIDRDRQFFAAHTGLGEPWATARETPLSHSLCKHVVDQDATLVIDDARLDPLYADNLGVADLGVVAYAGVPVRDDSGHPLGALCASSTNPRRWTDGDVKILTHLAGLASRLADLHSLRRGGAHRDAVTSLPGRAVFAALVERGLHCSEEMGSCAAMVALDLDNFRHFNDELGPAAGDALLRQVAARISGTLRGEDTVCRTAGDEFMIFCPWVRDEGDAIRIASRLVRCIADEPFDIEGGCQFVHATTGIATTETALPPHEMAEAARERLIAAKRGAELSAASEAEARLTLLNDVAGAHRRGEMWLAFQPLVELDSERIHGFEALLRWTHPTLGPIGPDEFIPLAEQSGAIVDIGRWVLERACAQLAQWRRMPGHAELGVSVNVAPVQVGVATFAQTVANILDRYELEPAALTLEITERTLLVDRPTHRTTLHQLRALGVALALDDFGTGYSALSYLTRMPLTEIKIDRAFVSELSGERSAAIITGITSMARALGMRTVAEGIEEVGQHDLLTELGCDLGQGYHYSRPIAEADVVAHLARRPATATA